MALSRRVSVVPLALANDGRSFFAEIYTKAYSGIVRVDATTSRYTEIKRFSDPTNDQAMGGFDGRWLVWTEYHSLYDTGRLHGLVVGFTHGPLEADRRGASLGNTGSF